MNRILKQILIIFFLISLFYNGYAQPKNKRMSPQEYIASYKDAAITDMQKTGVPASITLSQGMFESDYGNSPLCSNANNHFGIKCHAGWSGPTYHQDDDARDECFRKYNTVQESYDDHSLFLRSRSHYDFLFKLEITDYKGWAHGLKKAGYATNPQYAKRLIDIIERYSLNDLDNGGTFKPLIAESKGEKVTVPVTVGTEETENKGAYESHKEREIKAAEKPVPLKPTVSSPEKNSKEEKVARTEKTAKPIKKEKVTEIDINRKTINNNSIKVASPDFTSSTSINNVPFVRARKGDTWLKLSKQYNLEFWQLLSYNDADKNSVLKENDFVFLKTKKNKANIEEHIVRQGESMRSISQMYGIKVNKLYQMNRLSYDTEPQIGDTIYMKKTVLFGMAL